VLQAGGVSHVLRELQTCGFRGKWTESVEKTPVGEGVLVARLMGSLRRMKAEQRHWPSAYDAGWWGDFLCEQWRQPHSYVDRWDVAKMATFLRNFFRNQGISGFWAQTDLFNRFSASHSEYDLLDAFHIAGELKILAEYNLDWSAEKLDAPRVGNPWGYAYQGALLYEPVCQYFAQAAFLDTLLGNVESPIILEIGGGFGGLASFLLRRSRRMKYVGVDLPENLTIQAYYLSCVFPHLRVYVYDEDFRSLDREMAEAYDVVLLPTASLPAVASELVDLIVNVRSLSEMKQEQINEYFAQIARLKPRFFFHENIFKPRVDGLPGIPSASFPYLEEFVLLHTGPSRWPRYGPDSVYPCHENLFQLAGPEKP
jgi:putative sugar O-methyltransferase